jgi:hypothetical protein
MTKNLMLKLPDDVHASLKEYQIDRNFEDRTRTNLNNLLIEIIQAGTNRVNATADGILKRAALKKESQ